jgi:large subunit ribosomal protein L17
MPAPTKGPRLGGGPAHERLMLANLAAALFTHKSIQTTETKAKRLRPLAERLVTFAKRGDLHARRRVIQVLRNNKEAVHILFTEIAPQVSEREGGYTRITKLGYRKGDNAPMAAIELVLEPVVKKPVSAKKAAAAKAAAEAPKAPAVAAPAAEAPSEELVVTDGVVDEIVDAPVEAVAETTDAPVAEEAVAEEAAAPAEEAPAEEAPAEEAPADEATADKE